LETSNIFRLAAVLYADNNYNIKRESIIKKIVFVNRKMGHILIENWASCKKN